MCDKVGSFTEFSLKHGSQLAQEDNLKVGLNGFSSGINWFRVLNWGFRLSWISLFLDEYYKCDQNYVWLMVW